MNSPLADLLIALRFFTRLPVPATDRERALGAAGLTQAIALGPLAGAVVGLFPAAVLAAASALALPAPVAGALAVVTLILVTGALHEDALADCADGFGGGATREHKLAIMRDSRLGSYGACAVALSIFLRAACLGAIAARGSEYAAAVVVAAAALSRMACLMPLMLLPPARPDGTGASAGRPDPARTAIGVLIAIALALVVVPAGAEITRVVTAIGLVGVVVVSVCALAWRQIGGQTGDVAGATQQLAEIAVYLVLAAS